MEKKTKGEKQEEVEAALAPPLSLSLPWSLPSQFASHRAVYDDSNTRAKRVVNVTRVRIEQISNNLSSSFTIQRVPFRLRSPIAAMYVCFLLLVFVVCTGVLLCCLMCLLVRSRVELLSAVTEPVTTNVRTGKRSKDRGQTDTTQQRHTFRQHTHTHTQAEHTTHWHTHNDNNGTTTERRIFQWDTLSPR